MLHTATHPPGKFNDWAALYVNSFVDHDMFMRYLDVWGRPPCCTKQCNQVDVEQVDAMYIDVETEEGFEVNEDRPGPLGAAGLENL